MLINDVYRIIEAQNGSLQSTLATTLGVQGLYMDWLDRKKGTTLYEKIETILNQWKDHKNETVGDRRSLIHYLKDNQKANSCQRLIKMLESKKLTIKDNQKDEWDLVKGITYEIAEGQLARGFDFVNALARTLGVSGLYMDWLGTNCGVELFTKVSEILDLWRDEKNIAEGIREDLIRAL